MNDVLDISDSLVLEISGTFDIAIARKRLRQFANEHNLPTLLSARAAAATTTIAELVLFKSRVRDPHLRLTVQILNNGKSKGLGFQFCAPFTDDISKRFVVAEWQLERACDEIGIKSQDDDDLIEMRIWMNERIT